MTSDAVWFSAQNWEDYSKLSALTLYSCMFHSALVPWLKKILSSSVKSARQNMDVFKRRWNYSALITLWTMAHVYWHCLQKVEGLCVMSHWVTHDKVKSCSTILVCLLRVISNSDSLKWSGEQECGSVMGYKWVDVLKHWLSLYEHEVHLFPELVQFTWRNVSSVWFSWEKS